MKRLVRGIAAALLVSTAAVMGAEASPAATQPVQSSVVQVAPVTMSRSSVNARAQSQLPLESLVPFAPHQVLYAQGGDTFVIAHEYGHAVNTMITLHLSNFCGCWGVLYCATNPNTALPRPCQGRLCRSARDTTNRRVRASLAMFCGVRSFR